MSKSKRLSRWAGAAMIAGAAALAFAQSPKPGAKPPALPPAAPAATTTAPPADGSPANIKQMLMPTRIDFQCTNATSGEALAQLEKTLGFPLRRSEDFASSTAAKMTFDEKKQPMLSVVAKVCQQTSLRITTADQVPATSPFAVSGIFPGSSYRFYVPKQVDSSVMPYISSMSVEQFGKEKQRLRIRIAAAVEPKVCVIGFIPAADVDVALDDQGRSMIILNAQGKPEASPEGRGVRYPSRRNNVEVSYSMNYPPAPAANIKRLHGALKMVFGFNIQTKDMSAALEDGKTASTPLLRNAALTFSEFGRDPKDQRSFLMTMSVPRVRLPNGDFIEESQDIKAIRLEASSGENKPWHVTHGDMHVSQNGQAECTVRMWPEFQYSEQEGKTLRPTKFTTSVAGRTEESIITFDFADLPLPALKK